MTETEKTLAEYKDKLLRALVTVDMLKKDFKTCANELCLKCGNYREEHLGACNDCRWLPRRHGDFNDID